MSTFVVHTSLSQMHPIGSEGERSFARITSLMTRHLSESHAAILADPVPLRDGSGIDWYADVEGEVVPLSQLSAEEAQSVKAKLIDTLRAIREAADKLDADGTGKQLAAAVALRNAATFPGDDFIFAARSDGELNPIIVGWGYENHDAAVAHSFQISKFGPDRTTRPVPVPVAASVRQQPNTTVPSSMAVSLPATISAAEVPVAVVAERTRMGWGWLLPAIPLLLSLLLFIALTALLLPACGLRTPFGTVSFGFPSSYGCSSVAATILTPSLSAGNINDELQATKQEYQRRRLMCLNAQPLANVSPPVIALPNVPQNEAFNERIDNRGEAQVTLIWEGSDDLDLSVTCPDGKVIQYNNSRSCGGTLDVDQNARDLSPNPIENVTFDQGLPDPGTYKIGVRLYKSRMQQFPIPFKVRVRDQSGTRVLPGQLTERENNVQIGEMTR